MNQPPAANGEPPFARPTAAALLAAAGLLSELAWTRLAGHLFFGEVAFLVVSVAVAGLALGAAAGAAAPAWLRRSATATAALIAAAATAAGTAAALVLAGSGGPFLTVALALPGFAALGLAGAGLFASAPARAPAIYRADLLGAAAGAAAALPLLGALGPVASLALAAALAAAAAVVLAPVGARVRRFALSSAGVLLAIAAATVVGVLPSDPGSARLVTPKPATSVLREGGQLGAAAWGTMGRSELVTRADGAVVLYLDGAAGSLLPTPDSAALWHDDPARLAFAALRPGSVFVVGAGAGLEVAHALEHGAQRVIATELAGAGVRLAAQRYSAAATGAATSAAPVDPFDDPRVAWIADEARSVLRAQQERFDLIVMAQAVTRTAEARGLALAENGLYTVEAFGELLASLAPGGALALELYDEATLTRALFTLLRAMRQEGISEADGLARVTIFLDRGTRPATPLLIAFRQEPSRERVIQLARDAEARGLGLLHLPGLLENPPLDAVAAGTRDTATLAAAAQGVDLRPTWDDAPFFWALTPGVPRSLSVALVILLAASAVLAPALIKGPAGTRGNAPGHRLGVTVAGLLGLSFLAFELVALSRVQLLTGHPLGALALTLAALLIGAGLGAGAAAARPNRFRSLRDAALAAALLVAVWTWAWPFAAQAVQATPLALRAAVAAATLLPVGLALGAPLPLLLRRLGDGEPATVARAWALNGLGSLLAGVAATAAAHAAGYAAVGWAAVAGYLLAGAIATLAQRAAGRAGR